MLSAFAMTEGKSGEGRRAGWGVRSAWRPPVVALVTSCLAGLFCVAGLPAGQGAAAQTAAAMPKPAPQVPEKGAPTLEHLAKARQLILATGISRSFEIIIPEFMDQIGNTLTQARPDLVQDMNVVLANLKPEFDRQSDEMIDQSARIYASLLTENEIDAVLAFFNSEAGRKYVGAQPLFLNQLVSGMQAWQQKIAINMMSRVKQEMKKKGHDL